MFKIVSGAISSELALPSSKLRLDYISSDGEISMRIVDFG